MLKKLINVVVLVLALNFIVAAAGTAWVVKSGHVNHEKLKALKAVLYPPDSQPSTEPAAAADATSQPSGRLDELLAKASGRPAAEQIEFIRQEFAGETAELERRRRELLDLQRQVELARQQAAADRAKVTQERKALALQQDEQTKLASDKGFQDSLNLYTIMQPKQVKTIFMTLSEPTVVSYLQAMPPAKAGKIIKEFKAPDEVDRIQRVLERIRSARAGADAPAVAGSGP
jgi:hypothetical protein